MPVGSPGEFELVGGENTFLCNVHMGLSTLAKPWHHLTHGFCTYEFPPPKAQFVMNGDVAAFKVCGFFFIDVDPTMTVEPSNDPSSFDGTSIGTWVFLRDQYGVEYPVPLGNITFPTGVNVGSILCYGGVHGPVVGSAEQRSDGHVLEFEPPETPVDEDRIFDVIVRNYCTYYMVDDGTPYYRMDESVVTECISRNTIGTWEAIKIPDWPS